MAYTIVKAPINWQDKFKNFLREPFFFLTSKSGKTIQMNNPIITKKMLSNI
jgi:hypothetical protein